MEPLWVVGNEYFGSTFGKRGLDGTTNSARLIREPQNQMDKNAVGVHIGRKQVGYLSSARAEKIVKWIDSVGGSFDTSVTYRDKGADVLVPADWVAVPKVAKVNVQQQKKFQCELVALGVGDHKCKVVADGEQLNVVVDGVVVGRLYPKQLDQATLDKIVHNRLQKLVIEDSSFSDGVYARIMIPAPKALQPPEPEVVHARNNVAKEPESQVAAPAIIKSFIKGLFSR
jgi:hypothetical protein